MSDGRARELAGSLRMARALRTPASHRRLAARLRQAQARVDELEAQNRALAEQLEFLEYLHEESREMGAQLDASNHALAEANARLEAMATTDPLTGLPNHRAMVAAFDQELERARRYERPCAVMFLDIDHFKALNDGYGHAAGDVALEEFGQVVRAVLRTSDTLGRWGGEEFIALLPETDMPAALIAAERVRAAVAAHLFSLGGGMHLTCSLGVASYPSDAGQRDDLVEAADRAMYAAKKLGRNQVRAANDPLAQAGAEKDKAGSREETMLVGTGEALAGLVEIRDRYTGQHIQDVGDLTMRLAQFLGLDLTEARMVELAGRLHDVGKVAIPDAILQKPSKLTGAEWELMQAHPVVGADVVSRIPVLRALAPLIRAHHERWDGHGYPDRLAGTAVPLGARIIAVVDAYAAMTTDRPYRRACSPADAMAELRRCAATQFDPAVVDALEHVLVGLPVVCPIVA